MRNDQPLKILHLTAPAVVGGLETVVLALATGLTGRGHRLVLAAICDIGASRSILLEQASALGAETARLEVRRRAYLREYQAVATLVDRVRPDVMHTHGYRADLIGGLVARRREIPWVATVHGFTGGGAKNRLYEWLQVQSYRGASRAIAVSQPIQRRLEQAGVPRDRVTFLPNAWAGKPRLGRAAARHRLAIPMEGLVVGWVGRLSREKGADIFLEALALMGDQPWRASVLGDGPDRSALEARAEALGIAERVCWHGVVQEAAECFPAFDAFVLSSRTEGTPMALLEAVGAGVPAVSTAVGGVPDMFDPGEIWLVPAEAPLEIADALRRIAAEPMQAAARSAAAFETIRRRFDQGAWVSAHEELYRRITEATRANT